MSFIYRLLTVIRAGSVYIHPYDDPSVWEGHASLVDELKTQLGSGNIPDAMFCSVGGGGLLVCPNFHRNRVLMGLCRVVC